MTPLTNTAVVENVSDTDTPAFEPGCLSMTSNRGGNIATVGEDVFSASVRLGGGEQDRHVDGLARRGGARDVPVVDRAER